MRTYTTIQGDTWDLISHNLYGDEKYMRYLIQANWDYANVLIFKAGVIINVPDLPEEPDEDMPFWRDEDNEDDDFDEDEEDG